MQSSVPNNNLTVVGTVAGSLDGSGNWTPGGGGGGSGGTTTYTLSAPVAVAIATASAQIIPANPLRKYLIIQVNGAADVAIAPGAGAATLAAGFLLSANSAGAGYAGGVFTGNHVGAVQAIGRDVSSITWSEGV